METLNKVTKTFKIIWKVLQEIIPGLNIVDTVKKIKDIWNK